MKKLLLFAFAIILLAALCSCSEEKSEERETYYDIVERGNSEEIKAGAEKGFAEANELTRLYMDYSQSWKSFQKGEIGYSEFSQCRDGLISYFVFIGFSNELFVGTDEEIHNQLEDSGTSFLEEVRYIQLASVEIMKQEAMEEIKEKLNE